MDSQAEKLKFYPTVLCRIGTLPFEVLDNFRWSNGAALSTIISTYQSLKEDELSFVGKRKELASIQQKIRAFELLFEQKYLAQQQLHRSSFHAIAGNQMLQKGLLQSSPSLWQGIQRYRLQTPSTYRKKERQTERSIMQYLARICTKTSPFSTFTALSLNDLTGKNSLTDAPTHSGVIRINNYILAQLEELLGSYPPFYNQLAIRLNPTLRLQGEEYVYLMNSRNVESIQRMENNAVLALIVELIEEYEGGLLLFQNFVDAIIDKIDASRDQINGYLSELIQFGLLTWVWPVSATDPNWSKAFLAWLPTLSDFEGKENLINVLEQLQKSADQLTQLSAEERWPLIQENYQSLKNYFVETSAHIPDAKPIDNESFVLFKGTELSLNSEKLFYEDSQINANVGWSKEDLKLGIKELNEVITLINPLCIHPEVEAPLKFYKGKYDPMQKVGLMRFYEDFYQNELYGDEKKKNNEQNEYQEINKLQKNIAEKLSEHIIINSNYNVHLSLSDLKTAFAITQMKVAAKLSPNSFGALLQLQSTPSGQYKSYVDAVFTGYGRMLGRFLHLFPEKHTTYLQEWVADLRGNALWVDNTDASFHNANAHPSILNTIVSVPGGQQRSYIEQYPPNQIQEDNNVSLRDLSVSLSKDEDKLLLFYKDREVVIFNFGLEALQTRSPMYRLLSTFGTLQPDLSPLKAILLQLTRQEKESWFHFPRVCVGDHLILQRRSWFVPVLELPLRQKSDSEADYFLKINCWREKHQLPEQVFVTLSPLEIDHELEKEQRKSDAYKPQYLDFKIPSLVNHFGREVNKVTTMLKIEEALPGQGEMLKVNGRSHAVELVVQWAKES